MKTYTKTLTIAGSDSGGGAGIQADLKTFSALGCYGMSVITALTAQNTQGVQAIHEVSPAFVTQQINSVLQDMGTDAIKIGMLHRAEIIDVVASSLKSFDAKKIIIDPVMVAKGGSQLLLDDAIEKLRTELFPLATLITPNLLEAEILLGRKISNADAMQQAAIDLCEWGSQAVLLKGGHLIGSECNDCLYVPTTKKIHWLSATRIDTHHTHGTGCTLSAAITAYIAKNYSLFDAVQQAKNYLSQAILYGREYQLGQGHGPVHHFHHWW